MIRHSPSVVCHAVEGSSPVVFTTGFLGSTEVTLTVMALYAEVR